MAYIYSVPNITTGVDDAIKGTITAEPSFIPMFLVMVWFVVLIGGSITQRRRSGFIDFPQWSTLASLSTFILALLFTMLGGLIQLSILTITIAITLLSGIWLFLDS